MMIAVSFSKSNFTPAVFIAVLDSNNGMSESTVSVFILTSFPALTAGKLYSALDFIRCTG